MMAKGDFFARQCFKDTWLLVDMAMNDDEEEEEGKKNTSPRRMNKHNINYVQYLNKTILWDK